MKNDSEVVADCAFGEATWVEREAVSECGSRPQRHPVISTPSIHTLVYPAPTS